MTNIIIACAGLALIIAFCSATLVLVVKINLAAAVICVAAMVALLLILMGGGGRTRNDSRRAPGPAMQ